MAKIKNPIFFQKYFLFMLQLTSAGNNRRKMLLDERIGCLYI